MADREDCQESGDCEEDEVCEHDEATGRNKCLPKCPDMPNMNFIEVYDDEGALGKTIIYIMIVNGNN